MMELQTLRGEIDRIDEELVRLFSERMEVAERIAAYKKEHGLPVLDASRERAKLREVMGKAPAGAEEETAALYSLLFELSRARQSRSIGGASALAEEVERAIDATPRLFPERATVACQGVEGSYAQSACEKIFRFPNELYVSSFDAVFSAIEQGLCDYGVIPLENSTAGSVNRVYDLMQRHDFRIVRSVRLKVEHQLLAKEGTELADIREIYSHEQAIAQCAEFLRRLDGVRVIPCENTAVAAKMVAQSPRRDVAALSSRACMALYGLHCLAPDVQDEGNNFTRFICISKKLEIYPGADRTSLMLVLPHRPGSLYKVLARFYALGINLNKLESRPIPERNFEFAFYFDLDTPVYSPRFLQLLGELRDLSERFSYLGSYSEVV